MSDQQSLPITENPAKEETPPSSSSPSATQERKTTAWPKEEKRKREYTETGKKIKHKPEPPKEYTDTDGTIWPSKAAWKKTVKKEKFKVSLKLKKEKEKIKKKAKRALTAKPPGIFNPEDQIDNSLAKARRVERDERIRVEREGLAKDQFKVLIDCGFTSILTEKESLSLAKQIAYCYAFNKRNEVNPTTIQVTELDGIVRTTLDKANGFPQAWKLFEPHTECMTEVNKLEDMVYLTADSENVINELDDSKTYIIGGIVDRNRLKFATLKRSGDLGIQTARLPIGEHLKMCATSVLTVNHVYEILCRWKGNGGDWGKAMIDTLPTRKKAAVAVEKEGEEKVGGEEEGDENVEIEEEDDDDEAEKDDDEAEDGEAENDAEETKEELSRESRTSLHKLN